MTDVPGLRDHEAKMDADWALEIAAEPVAAELLDVVSDAALAFLADMPYAQRALTERALRDKLRTWAQNSAECLLEARAKEDEPAGGWDDRDPR